MEYAVLHGMFIHNWFVSANNLAVNTRFQLQLIRMMRYSGTVLSIHATIPLPLFTVA